MSLILLSETPSTAICHEYVTDNPVIPTLDEHISHPVSTMADRPRITTTTTVYEPLHARSMMRRVGVRALQMSHLFPGSSSMTFNLAVSTSFCFNEKPQWRRLRRLRCLRQIHLRCHHRLGWSLISTAPTLFPRTIMSLLHKARC